MSPSFPVLRTDCQTSVVLLDMPMSELDGVCAAKGNPMDWVSEPERRELMHLGSCWDSNHIVRLAFPRSRTGHCPNGNDDHHFSLAWPHWYDSRICVPKRFGTDGSKSPFILVSTLSPPFSVS